MSKRHFYPIILTFISVFSLNSNAEYLDNTYVENFAKTYVEEHISTPANGKSSIIVANIDPRVKLNVCKIPLEAKIPENFNSRNANIKISCDDSTPWHIYLAVKINTQLPVIIASKSISKGTLLTANNTRLAYIDSYKLRGSYINDANAIVGSKAKRNITRNKPITRKYICMVCEGQSVSIIAKSTNFTIKTNGKALNSGNIGDQIRVKNSRSGKTVTAQVNAINKVLINL